jgi:hypothetical protein
MEILGSATFTAPSSAALSANDAPLELLLSPPSTAAAAFNTAARLAGTLSLT